MRGNFGLFRTFSPKLPRIHVDYIVMQMRKINREKGYCNGLTTKNQKSA